MYSKDYFDVKEPLTERKIKQLQQETEHFNPREELSNMTDEYVYVTYVSYLESVLEFINTSNPLSSKNNNFSLKGHSGSHNGLPSIIQLLYLYSKYTLKTKIPFVIIYNRIKHNLTNAYLSDKKDKASDDLIIMIKENLINFQEEVIRHSKNWEVLYKWIT